jgi:hypothetical protein
LRPQAQLRKIDAGIAQNRRRHSCIIRIILAATWRARAGQARPCHIIILDWLEWIDIARARARAPPAAPQLGQAFG